ncbi:MAG TPA: RidA family protein, partial [bacterium]|nr:RidA family protein [bacterium]
MSISARLQELGIAIPPAPAPAANYVPYVVEGRLVFIAGQGPFAADGTLQYLGKVGQQRTEQEGYASARLCALNCLAQLQAAAGSLERVKRIVRVGGFVNCGPDFGRQPQVVNGASDLLVQIFGERGRHARTAVGTCSLPMDTTTEIEM